MGHGKEAARSRCSSCRARVSARDAWIVSDYDRACLVGGLMLAASFGCMFMWAAVMW